MRLQTNLTVKNAEITNGIEGNFIGTETYGKSIYVTTMDRLSVTDKPLPDCDIQFLGKLTDAYQRELLTEVIEAHIGD